MLSAAGGVGTVFPASDTIGSALIGPPVVAGDSVSRGFLVLENYDNIGALGDFGTLTSEAIIFNLASGFLYSQRGLFVIHFFPSPAGFVIIDSPFLSFNLQATPFSAGSATTFSHHPFEGTLARFMFLPPATATTGAYVIALNRIGTDELNEYTESFNLVSPDYNARIRLEARMDASQGYALGVYNRLEDFRSITQANEIVCLAQLSPSQLVGAGIDVFIANGGWVNLPPRCWESEVAGVFQVCDGDAAGTEFGDSAVIYKVEFAAGYGFAVTPQHQQWYAK